MYGTGGYIAKLQRACLGEFSQPLGLRGPELIHPALEVLEVALDGVPLLHEEAVPLRVLLYVLRDLRGHRPAPIVFTTKISFFSYRQDCIWLCRAYTQTVGSCRER